MRTMLAAGIAFCSMFAWAQEARRVNPARARTRAVQLDTDQRIAHFSKLREAKPQDTHVAMELAAAFLQKTRETGDYSYQDRAGKLIAYALETDAKNLEALRMRNIIDMSRHDFPKVAKTARQMLAIFPGDPVTWGTLGDALMETGQYKDALEAYRKMADLRQGMESDSRIAWHRFVTGDAAQAIELMNQAVMTATGFPENKAWCQAELGSLYFKTGRIAESEKAYRDAIQTFPRLHSAHAGLGAVLAAQGRLAEAIQSYVKAQSILPMAGYAASLADLYEISGQKDDARKQIQLVDVAAQLDKAANQKADRGLALIYANQERHLDEALELAKADLDLRPDVYSWDAMAWVLYKNKRREEARKASAEALKLGTAEPMFYYHAGMIAQALGDGAEARKLLGKALALNPKFDVRQAEVAAGALGH